MFVSVEHRVQLRLVSLGEGNNARNSIPNHCECVVVVPTESVAVFETQTQKYWLECIGVEFSDIEPRMHFESRPIDDFAFATTTVCDVPSTQRVCHCAV